MYIAAVFDSKLLSHLNYSLRERLSMWFAVCRRGGGESQGSPCMDADWPSTLDAQRQADGRRTGPELPAANQLQPAALPLDRAATSILRSFSPGREPTTQVSATHPRAALPHFHLASASYLPMQVPCIMFIRVATRPDCSTGAWHQSRAIALRPSIRRIATGYDMGT